jgi:putative NIF3 family GTP cyclohydrolase 1 type 2
MRHHDALAAGAAGLNVVCVNHSNSERITLERLRERLAQSLPQIRCELSRADRDPFEIV